MQQSFKSTEIYRNISICLSLVSCNIGYGQQKSSDPSGKPVLDKTFSVNMTPHIKEFTNINEISSMSLFIPATNLYHFLKIKNINPSTRR